MVESLSVTITQQPGQIGCACIIKIEVLYSDNGIQTPIRIFVCKTKQVLMNKINRKSRMPFSSIAIIINNNDKSSANGNDYYNFHFLFVLDCFFFLLLLA